MTGEELERAMEFILKQQSQFNVDLALLREAQAQTGDKLDSLSSTVNVLASTVATLETQAASDRREIREAINNLIIANESTRELSQNVARLAIQTSHPATDLESKL